MPQASTRLASARYRPPQNGRPNVSLGAGVTNAPTGPSSSRNLTQRTMRSQRLPPSTAVVAASGRFPKVANIRRLDR
jgi:hypothetical protein